MASVCVAQRTWLQGESGTLNGRLNSSPWGGGGAQPKLALDAG